MNKELKEKVINLLQNNGVYSKISDITFEKFDSLNADTDDLKSLDLFCPNCKTEKTFAFKETRKSSIFGITSSYCKDTPSSGAYTRAHENILEISFKCPTCDKKVVFFLLFDNHHECIIKIGQYPSLMDINRNEISKHKKLYVLDDEYFEELKKAEVCASESYYVASFLYLRRVFENLIYNIFKQNQEEISKSDEEFKQLHSDKKIKLLKPYLAIDESIYKPLYELLSEGVHSLPEEECEKNYELLKCILLDILEEQESRKRKQNNRQNLLNIISQKKGGSSSEKQ